MMDAVRARQHHHQHQQHARLTGLTDGESARRREAEGRDVREVQQQQRWLEQNTKMAASGGPGPYTPTRRQGPVGPGRSTGQRISPKVEGKVLS